MADVNALIADARGYAAGALAAGNTAINSAIATANSLGRTIGGDDLPIVNLEPPAIDDVGEPPVSLIPIFTDPGLGAAAPILQALTTLDLSGDPGQAPAVHDFEDPGNRPDGDPGNATLLQGVPDFDPNDFLVDKPPNLLEEIRGVPKPTLIPINVRAAPAYVEPQFLGTRPSNPTAPPTGLDTTFRTQFNTISPIMRAAINAELDQFIDREFPACRSGLAALEAKLSTYLAGGTAVNPAVEDALFARTTEKGDAEYRRGRDKIFSDAARAGHTLPSPVIVAQDQVNDQARRDANAQAARDLMIKVFELEQQNMQFAITTSASLRGMMFNAGIAFYQGQIQINGQALEYARSVVDAIVKVYDIAARYSEIQARIYEAEGTIYSAKVRGALGALEAYSAYVRGLEAQSNVDLAQVQVYKVRIEAIQAEATVYQAQVSANNARLEVERLKVDIYRARAGAYGAQVNAYTARYQGYEAAVRGETARVQASAEQVRAFSAEADAYRAVISARSQQLESINRSNDGKVKVFESLTNAYRARVDALATVQRARVESSDVALRTFVARANAIAETSRAYIARFEASLRAVIASAEMEFRLLHEGHDLDIHRVQAIAQLSTAAAANYTAIAQSAGSGMNTLIAQIAQE